MKQKKGRVIWIDFFLGSKPIFLGVIRLFEMCRERNEGHRIRTIRCRHSCARCDPAKLQILHMPLRRCRSYDTYCFAGRPRPRHIPIGLVQGGITR
jgi:hypothetical protein